MMTIQQIETKLNELLDGSEIRVLLNSKLYDELVRDCVKQFNNDPFFKPDRIWIKRVILKPSDEIESYEIITKED